MARRILIRMTRRLVRLQLECHAPISCTAPCTKMLYCEHLQNGACFMTTPAASVRTWCLLVNVVITTRLAGDQVCRRLSVKNATWRGSPHKNGGSKRNTSGTISVKCYYCCCPTKFFSRRIIRIAWCKLWYLAEPETLANNEQ